MNQRASMKERSGLYDPDHERDNCGFGFIAHIKGKKTHKLVRDGLQILANLDHRGAVGADPLAGDGAGILVWQRLMRSIYRVNSGPRRAHLRSTSPIFSASVGE